MATTTVTITSATNPTYGGTVAYDGVSAYSRKVLNQEDTTVSFDGATTTKRSFAFFDLSTDPTGGGTITKVELLATVSSVSGTHAVKYSGGDYGAYLAVGPPPTDEADSFIYNTSGGASGSYDFGVPSTPSAGAMVVDLGSEGVSQAIGAIADTSFMQVGIALSNEAVAGSVVFDAAVGFGLRLTYTPASTGFNAMMLTGAGA